MARPSKTDDLCPTGVCGADVPPIVGTVLTGTGMTIAQAAARIAAGEEPQLSDVQRRIAEEYLLAQRRP
jgi:hypothetical protein